jgi:endonuclease YncB( thermonuclease family)
MFSPLVLTSYFPQSSSSLTIKSRGFMSFTLIKGKFTPQFGEPDGDSVRFLANNRRLLFELEGRRPNISRSNGTVQLRFEGIDAIEKGAIKPLSTQAKDSMLDLIGYDKNTNPTPEGYILARMVDDSSGRPICFVFAGNTERDDGDDVFLDANLLQDSVNYQQVLRGYAYPLYYNTLFVKLRKEFNKALAVAKKEKKGYWSTDKTLIGVTVKGKDDLKTIDPIWPKLWRRLEEYFRSADSLTGFIEFLEVKNERIDILSEMEERGLQDIVEVQGDLVKLTESPENIRVVGNVGRRTR